MNKNDKNSMGDSITDFLNAGDDKLQDKIVAQPVSPPAKKTVIKKSPTPSLKKGAKIILSLEDINKTYLQGGEKLDILKNASLEIYKGEMVSLVGESGCGKSTLLHVAGLLDVPDSGKIEINGRDCTNISDNIATEIRRDEIGFVYQYHHLLQEFTALENVMMPQLLKGVKKNIAQQNAEHILTKMGLKSRMKHLPSELSGGEQQRTAISRALSNSPAILLADEPTGNLDPSTADEVFEVLLEYVVETGLSMFLVTHNHELASKTDRVLTFSEGATIPLKAL